MGSRVICDENNCFHIQSLCPRASCFHVSFPKVQGSVFPHIVAPVSTCNTPSNPTQYLGLAF